MMPTEFLRMRRRRPASADFCLLMLGAGCIASVQAADVPVVVMPPKPVVIQPAHAMAPPPVAPEVTEAAPRPASRSGAKPKKAAKAKGKPKPKNAKSRQR